MGINLGFESLGIRGDRSGDLSYEYLDSLIQFNNAATEVLDLCHELSGVVRTYSQLDAITKTIKKYGVTQSLEALYGENFSGAASMEAENEEAKKGLGQKIKEIINLIINKLKDFWRWMTDSGERAMRALQKAKFTGKFSYSHDLGKDDEKRERDVNTASEFDGIRKNELFEAYNNAKRTLGDAQQKLKGLQSKPNPSQEEVMGQKGAVEDAVKLVKKVVTTINSFVAGSKKGKGGDDQKAIAAGGSDTSKDNASAGQTAPEENAAK